MSSCTNAAKWIVLITSNVLLWTLVFGYIHLNNRPIKKVEKLSEKALYSLVENPSSINVLSETKPQRFYGNQLLTDEEQDDINASMTRLNQTIMKRTANFTNFDDAGQEVSDLMQRHMNTVTSLQSLMSTVNIADKKDDKFAGWKQKIEYTAVSNNGIPYRSQFWFFFDKDGDILTRSFEIPLMDS